MSSLSFSDQLHALHAALHLAHTPASMPCREQQQETLRRFLTEHLLGEGKGGALYVSGAPGTGHTHNSNGATRKTASVEHVVHQMFGHRFFADAHRTEEGGSRGPKSKTKLLAKLCASSPAAPLSASSSSSPSAPRILYTNAMAFASKPSALYPRLLAQVRGLSAEQEMALPSPMECLNELQQIFCPADAAAAAAEATRGNSGSGSGKKNKGSTSSGSTDGTRMTLIVLDEVDALLRSAHGAVLYHLFSWPRRPHARVALVAISNSLNLLEQKLPELARLTGGALPQSLLFRTYAAEELEQIVLERCQGVYAQAEKKEKEREDEKKEEREEEEKARGGDKEEGKQEPSAPVSPARRKLPPTPRASPSRSPPASLAASLPPRPAPRSSPRSLPSSSSIAALSRTAAAAAREAPRSSRKRKPQADVEAITEGQEDKQQLAKSEEQQQQQQQQQAGEDQTVSLTMQNLRVRSDTPTSTIAVADTDAACDSSNPLLVTPKKRRKGDSDVAASPMASPISSPTAVAASPASPSSPFPSPSSSSAFSSSSSPSSCPVHILPATASRPIFAPDALRFLCMKVSKGSGDLRKVLEVLRKCVDGLRVEAETIQRVAMHQAIAAREAQEAAAAAAASTATTDSSASSTATASERVPSPSELSDVGALDTVCLSSVPSAAAGTPRSAAASPTPSVHPSLQVSMALMHGMVIGCLGGGAGEQEGLLRSLPVQQKVLLTIAALLSHLQGGREQLHHFPRSYARFSSAFALEPLRGADFADLLAALAAHKLITLDKPVQPRGSKRSNSSGGGGGVRSAPASGGGGGSGRRGPAPCLPSPHGASAGALGAIQVNVSLSALECAFAEDALMERLLSKGKALATSLLAANRARSEVRHEDYVMRDIEEP